MEESSGEGLETLIEEQSSFFEVSLVIFCIGQTSQLQQFLNFSTHAQAKKYTNFKILYDKSWAAFCNVNRTYSNQIK